MTGHTVDRSESAVALLAAIVENSDDAIISKSLDGVILSWNRGAQSLFHYTPEEAIGQPITLLIPEERLHEEAEILNRIRHGERVEHFQTQRRQKSGSLVEISLTVSPVRDQDGRIIGASKIARDITAIKRAEHQKDLLLREMNHRVKNLFAVVTGLLSISRHTAGDMDELTDVLRERILALARAHELTLPDMSNAAAGEVGTTLFSLLRAIFEPHTLGGNPRLAISGTDVPLRSSALTSLALLLHEFATNAAKYGALLQPDGHVVAHAAIRDETLVLDWTEVGGPLVTKPQQEGFGSLLERGTVQGLDGTITRNWAAAGIAIELRIPLCNIISEAAGLE